MKSAARYIGKILFWSSWPLLWVYLKHGTRTRIVVFCGSEVLVVKGRIGLDRWGLPGGGVHGGETPAEGAVRELLEETGISATPAQLQTLAENAVASEYGLKYMYTSFALQLGSKTEVKKQHIELAEAAWLPVRDLLRGSELNKDARTILASWSEM